MSEDPDDDRLLHDLAAFAREEEAREEAILAEIRGAGEEAFRPLGPAFVERVTGEILRSLGAPLIQAARPRHPESRLRAAGRLGRFGWRGLIAAALAGAAILLGPRLFVPPFPAYALTRFPLGEASERSLPASDLPEAGVPSTPALFRPGTAFEVAATPLRAIDDLHGRLEVRCILQGAQGAQVRDWPSCAERAEIAPTQAVRIAGTLGEDLTLEPGTWNLWIVLGREGKVAGLERRPALFAGPSVAKRDWIALRVPRPLRMEPAP